VLDISENALNRSIKRMGESSGEVDWLVGDALREHFPENSVDLWHDRAVLHFMEGDKAVAYRDRLRHALKPGGYAVIATFAPDGPRRCSGLEVTRYSANGLVELLGDEFEILESTEDVHETPWGTEQRFTYALLRQAQQALSE
jgi:ubiquinone/menaquinone biosynthesis C-methylase UbiE